LLNTIPPAIAVRPHMPDTLCRAMLQRPGADVFDKKNSIHCAEYAARDRQAGLHDYELHLTGALPGRIRVSDGADREVPPEAVVLLGPRLPHRLAIEYRATGAAEQPRGLVLRFGDEPLRRGMELFPELNDAGPLLARARHGVQFLGLGEGTIGRFRRIHALQGLARFSEFTALLSELAQWNDYRLLCTPSLQEDAHDENGRATRIHTALDHIRENYAEELSLAEVSAMVGMREHTFSRCFRRATGQTFTDVVIGLRVDKACRLLLSTRQHVSSICYEVGFNNISNFNRHFRRLKGMAPGEFRAIARE